MSDDGEHKPKSVFGGRTMKKEFEEYIIGEIIKYKGHTYRVRLKTVRSHFIKMAGKTFYTNILYLEAIDTLDNRVAKVTRGGTLEFIHRDKFKWKPTKGDGSIVYETWNETTIGQVIKHARKAII